MRRIIGLSVLGLLILSGTAVAQFPDCVPTHSELLMSEYVEGSFHNKAIEIYNGTCWDLDLGAEGYNISIYFGGGTQILTTPLSGNLAAGDVFVIAHPQATFPSDQPSSFIDFNGNDVVELRLGGSAVDSIGMLETVFPDIWCNNGVCTAEQTLRRKADVRQGDTDSFDPFDPSIEWDSFPRDDFSGLGSHTVNCGSALHIPTRPGVVAGEDVEVPFHFTANGASIAAVSFSVDHDNACLTFDPTDGNGDQIPDAITFQTPAAFDQIASVDPADTDGEIDILIFDFSVPMATLPDDTLATITFGTATTPSCTPAGGTTIVAPMLFSVDPEASFGTTSGQSGGGTAIGWPVVIVPADARGDCNADTIVDAGDITAIGLEIFDGDGDFWLDTFGGTFLGSPAGCDANGDELVTHTVDAGDISCTNKLIFGDTCGGGGESVVPGNPSLSLEAELIASPDGTVVAQVRFEGQEHDINSVVFSLDFNQDLLVFDDHDSDQDGVPDSVHLHSGLLVESVGFNPNDSQGELDFLITDFASVPRTLTDGLLVEVELQLIQPADTVVNGVLFSADPRASFGDVDGRGVPGTAEMLYEVLFADGFDSGDFSAWTSAVQ